MNSSKLFVFVEQGSDWVRTTYVQSHLFDVEDPDGEVDALMTYYSTQDHIVADDGFTPCSFPDFR